MMRGAKRICAAATAGVGALALALAPGVNAQTKPVTAREPGRLVLNGVTMVDVEKGTLSRARAIAIEKGRIVAIGASGSLKPGRSGRVVEARGKFVVPGYLDMHAHPLGSSDPEGSLALMLANGVTGFRQMSGSPALLQARRAGTLPLSDRTPALLAMPGDILTPQNAGTPEAAVAEIDRQKAMGADFAKVVAVSPPAFFAALAQAKRNGMPFVGHLPPTVPIRDASKAGMRAIEHLGPTESILLGCSTQEDALRAELLRRPPTAPSPGAPAPMPGMPALTARTLVNPMVATPPAGFAHIARLLASQDDARCRDVARTLATNGTWQVPTLLRVRTMEFGDDAAYRNDPNLRYVPLATRKLWAEVADDFARKMTPETRATLARLFAAQLRLVKLFEQADVPMLAGTDFGGGWEVAGISLHREFDLLAQAGLRPLTILRMTTINGARFLGREATMGSVAVGRNADLVLLDADPLASVAALHKIEGVVRAGRYYPASVLTEMKTEVARRQR